MKTLVKMGLVALTVSMLAAGCSGCGDKNKSEEPARIDSPKKTIDTTKAKIDTAKKDTSKK